MEFEDVNTKGEIGRRFETRRLTAILNIAPGDVHERYSFNDAQIHGECLTPLDGIGVEWRFETLNDAATESEDAEWVLTEIVFSTREDSDNVQQIALELTGEGLWEAAVDEKAPLAMRRLAARACYCLGVEDEVSWQSLNYPLSSHECTELRLSMPREFWPKKWLDEEGQ